MPAASGFGVEKNFFLRPEACGELLYWLRVCVSSPESGILSLLAQRKGSHAAETTPFDKL
nr:hypothetical protein [uncultured Desulfobulbus sp.]